MLDLDATVAKACDLIREAAQNGAKLVVFPEMFIPTYVDGSRPRRRRADGRPSRRAPHAQQRGGRGRERAHRRDALFVEEVTRLLFERGEAGGLQATPPTLQQSLAARLDRLGPAREVAQIGAVLGRDFTYALLQAAGEVAAPGLQSSLDQLAEADLLIAAGAGPQATYRFKHALLQDAAYDSLLRDRRHALHRRAAEILRNDPERAAAAAEIIAHHFTEAGLNDLAIEWWGKAGDPELPAPPPRGDRPSRQGDRHGGQGGGRGGRAAVLASAYGNALIAARGYGSPETTRAFTKAREEANGEEGAPERLSAEYGLWGGSAARGELPAMREHSASFLSEVEARPDSPEACIAHRMAGKQRASRTRGHAARHRTSRNVISVAAVARPDLRLRQDGRGRRLSSFPGGDETARSIRRCCTPPAAQR